MSTHTALWPEIRRAGAQWSGVVAASLMSGLLLGVLLRQGARQRLALEIAMSVGFLLAVIFWMLINRRFTVKPIQIQTPVSSNVPTFEGQLTTSVYSVQYTAIPTLACQSPVA